MLLEAVVDTVPPVKGPRGRPGGPANARSSSIWTRATTTRAAGGRCAAAASRHGSPDVVSSRARSWAGIGMWSSGRWRGWWALGKLQVRYERRADILLGFVQLACALICLKHLNRPTGGTALPQDVRRSA
jgi:hypothetical protein